MQNYVYLVTHNYMEDSNAIFYTIENAKNFIAGRLIVINEGVSVNDDYYSKEEDFIIYKLYIGQRFEGEIDCDRLEKVK